MSNNIEDSRKNIKKHNSHVNFFSLSLPAAFQRVFKKNIVGREISTVNGNVSIVNSIIEDVVDVKNMKNDIDENEKSYLDEQLKESNKNKLKIEDMKLDLEENKTISKDEINKLDKKLIQSIEENKEINIFNTFEKLKGILKNSNFEGENLLKKLNNKTVSFNTTVISETYEPPSLFNSGKLLILFLIKI